MNLDPGLVGNYLNEGEGTELEQWLRKLKLEKYQAKFIEEEYDEMKMIRDLNKSQVEEMITALGCKPGSAMAIRSDLNGSEKMEFKREGRTCKMDKRQTI
eukprot:TRINITY_DN3265_c0_g1_i1.p1 TRINITY_DN3265_c0_g1~~TRINITY_DN3265_c0_g1_i1.p1  ORF type:complete len:100 (+),score=16.67 TRINITY_DN3265_c0_g1_i1:355-654(+)